MGKLGRRGKLHCEGISRVDWDGLLSVWRPLLVVKHGEVGVTGREPEAMEPLLATVSPLLGPPETLLDWLCGLLTPCAAIVLTELTLIRRPPLHSMMERTLMALSRR